VIDDFSSESKSMKLRIVESILFSEETLRPRTKYCVQFLAVDM